MTAADKDGTSHITAVDIYLDVDWAEDNPGSRFNWSVALNKPNVEFVRGRRV